MTIQRIELPAKLVSLFDGTALYRVAHGGRGSGKTRSLAKMSAVKAHIWASAGVTGVILCGREFMNSLADSSFAEVKAAIVESDWLSKLFICGETFIKTICGKVEYVFAGLRKSLSSIKSKARILLCWVDEAEDVSEIAWETLDPTIREEGAELWVSYNPASNKSATHKKFRANPDEHTKIVEVNWRDNPWFPKTLDIKRKKHKLENPDTYGHVWEGEFRSAMTGAYFVKQISAMRKEGRLCRLAPDPNLSVKAYFDIGGTGARADARSIWLVQFVGREIRVVGYRETQGQPLASDIEWLNSLPYPVKTCVLPHDGATNDRVYDVSYESALTAAGFTVEIVTNQGRGAAMSRIEAVRRVFAQVWMDVSCEMDGLAALAAYHEKRDETRGIGLGPNHDWSSHGSDAFGLMAIYYETNKPMVKSNSRLVIPNYAGA
jgi:phage terminase large subunit